MQPFKRQQFICSAIAQCQETVNCCAHKQPHIKDERCVPRQCRYAPNVEDIDCVVFVAPVPVSVAVPAPVTPIVQISEALPTTVAFVVKENTLETIAPVVSPVTITEVLAEKETTIKHDDSLIPDLIAETVTQEINIKAAVKKQASSKKKGRKA